MTEATPQHPDELVEAAPPAAEPTRQQPTPMIIAEGLDLGTGELRVLAGLDFEVGADRLAVIIGPAGTGKSALLAAIVGRFTGVRGRIEVAGLDADRQSRQLRKITTVARLGSFVDLEPKHSITDALAERAAIEGIRLRQAERVYDELADLLDLDLDPGQLIDDLDGYQRAALTVILAMLRPSSVLVLDDAHRDLTIDDQHRLLGRLVDLAGRTATTIVVSTVEPTTIPYEAVRIDLPELGKTRTHPSR
ncbi:hypothetical protein GCM10011575_36740 [Microlunatus endophyticus]|uniref:ABC transporter domain-containing protein n=1 Tax=Microlunatus endophyticus TaxID=1716077 RepID=A0A917SEP6_9ACTN|nr:ATP-binding cassette domain-containing protein [Microlunatus endophyticus]GGL75228.1 hypothetical protein GCM10011575_36740 [Microlunatus endophyticus]